MATASEYVVEFRPGWGANGHFGQEIAARLRENGEPIRFPTLAEARTALRAAKADHGGRQPGRFDIVQLVGGKEVRRHRWE